MKRLTLILLGILLVMSSGTWAQGRQADFRILYLNDFHGFVEPPQPVGTEERLGGVVNLAAAVNNLRREKPSLLLAAGDMIYVKNWANPLYGESVIALMNAMKFDAMTVGNHEFDYGPKVLKQRIAEARFPVLGANVEGFPSLKPYVIKELKGVKIGIIGVITDDTPTRTGPRNVAGLKFISPEIAVEKYMRELQGKVDLIIVLSHIGFQADRSLAARVPGIDVIVGGHSHTKVLQSVVVGRTIIVQAWEHGKTLGVLDLKIQDGKITGFDGYLQEIKPVKGATDQGIQKIVAHYSQKVDVSLNQAIGEAAVDLEGTTSQVRTRETNLGNLLADIMKEAAGADAAIVNGGTIRAGIPQGTITQKDVSAVLPFDNYLVAVRLSGRQVREALEHGVSALGEAGGRFPQVSGLRFTYRRAAPAGSRVQEITVGGQPLQADKEYLIATSDFLAAGGDGYQSFSAAVRAAGDYADVGGVIKSKNLVISNPANRLRNMVIDYIQARKIIAPQVEGRIKELN